MPFLLQDSTYLAITLFFGLFALPTHAQSSSPVDIVGTWYAEEGGMYVEIEPCEDDAFCGRIVRLEDGQPRLDENNPDRSLRDRPLEGLRILTDLRFDPDDEVWTDGRMYAPQRGREVNVELQLRDKDALQVRASRFVFRRTMVWTRQEP